MSYDFAHVSIADARAWFDMLIARLNTAMGRTVFSPLSHWPAQDQQTLAMAMQQFFAQEIARRIDTADPQPHAVTVPTLDEIARTLLALDRKDKQRIYQLLYNDGCRINR